MDSGHAPTSMLLWVWLLVAPVALVLLDAMRLRGDRARTRARSRDEAARGAGTTARTPDDFGVR